MIRDTQNGSVPIRKFAQNPSRGGFCLQSHRPAIPGERVLVSLEEPAGLLVVAKVQWQLKSEADHLLGCVFSDKADFAHLQNACRSCLAE